MNLLEACNVRAGDKERYRMRTIIIEKGVERVVVSFFFKNRIDESSWDS